MIMPRWSEKSLWGVMGIKFPYLSLTTLAALTPPDIEVRIMDENVEAIDFDSRPDLVAVSLMTPLAPRGYEIADQFRIPGDPGSGRRGARHDDAGGGGGTCRCRGYRRRGNPLA